MAFSECPNFIHITICSDGVKICQWLSRFSQGNTFYASMTCFHEMLSCALYWTRSKSSLVSKLMLQIVLLDFIFDSGFSDSKNADSFSWLDNANILFCFFNFILRTLNVGKNLKMVKLPSQWTPTSFFWKLNKWAKNKSSWWLSLT